MTNLGALIRSGKTRQQIRRIIKRNQTPLRFVGCKRYWIKEVKKLEQAWIAKPVGKRIKV